MIAQPSAVSDSSHICPIPDVVLCFESQIGPPALTPKMAPGNSGDNVARVVIALLATWLFSFLELMVRLKVLLEASFVAASSWR